MRPRCSLINICWEVIRTDCRFWLFCLPENVHCLALPGIYHSGGQQVCVRERQRERDRSSVSGGVTLWRRCLDDDVSSTTNRRRRPQETKDFMCAYNTCTLTFVLTHTHTHTEISTLNRLARTACTKGDKNIQIYRHRPTLKALQTHGPHPL